MSPASVEALSYAKFSARDVPWWGTGTSAKEMVYAGRFLTDEEASRTFPWHVELLPTYQRKTNNTYAQVKDSFQITLIHDNPYNPDHQSVLGVVGGGYTTDWQPTDLLAFGSELTDNYGAKWSTVGDLKHHTIIFGSLKLESVKDTVSTTLSPTDWYLLVTNDFTGNGSFRCDIVPIPPVCMNTHSLALKSAAVTWKLRHVGDMKRRTFEAKHAMGLVEKYQEEYSRIATQLATSEFELEAFRDLTNLLLPTKGVDAFTGKRIGPNTSNANELNRTSLVANFLHSATIEDDWRMTKWGALNAITEWSEWIFDRRTDKRTDLAERRMFTTLLGVAPQAQFRQKAFNLLTH